MDRWSMRTFLVAGLLATTLLVPAGAVHAAGLLPSVFARIGSVCKLGGALASPPMTVEVTSASGRSKLKQDASFSGGGWSVDCSGIALQPGDQVILRDGDGKELRAFRVPDLHASLDRVENRITGVAKGSKLVEHSLLECTDMNTTCTVSDTGLVSLAEDGSFVINPKKNLTGRTMLSLFWQSGTDTVIFEGFFPQLVVTLDSAKVSGTGDPGAKVVITDRRGGKVAKGSSKPSAKRKFKGILKRARAQQRVKSGDRISWAMGGDKQGTFTVPKTSATPGRRSTRGDCLPNRIVSVQGRSPDGKSTRVASGVSTSDGSFNVSLALEPGWTVTVECQTAEGDAIRFDAGVVPG